MVKRTVKRSRPEDIHFHNLRHSYITYRLAAGIDPKTTKMRSATATADDDGLLRDALWDATLKGWVVRQFRFHWGSNPIKTRSGTTQITTHPIRRNFDDAVTS